MKDIEDEIPFDVPDGWSWCRLKEIGNTNIGLTYHPVDLIKTGIPVLRSNNIKDDKLCLSDLARVQTKILNNQFVSTGDILICARNGSKNLVGKCTIISNLPEKMAFGAFMAVFRSEFNPYILRYLQSIYFKDYLEESNSTQIYQLTQNMLKEAFLPLPPLSEQQLIDAEIEKIFAQIDLLEQNKTDLQTAIKQTKSKILDLAIHGKLVPQDPNDEPASVLLEKIRAEKEEKIAKGELKRDKNDSYIYKGSDNCHYQKNADGSIINIEGEIPFEVPESWCWCRFGEICEFIGGVSYKKNDITNTGIRILRGGNIQAGKIIDEIDDVFVPFSYFDKNNSVYENDIVLVASTGSNLLIGKTGFAYKNLQNTQIGAFLRIIRTDNSFYAKYNNIVLLSEYYKTYIRNIAGGTNINNVKTEYLSNFLIPLPPLTEQTRIVAKIEELFTLLDNIQNNLI
ncbi:MAG: restriction endonuclease subunit S [Treponema sp.]|nr:restriction endonuclease subunit S [Treponema sp.]